MILRKQTVWLLTMLAVMVVLSGYYMVKGPNDQVPAATDHKEAQKENQQITGIEVDTKQLDQPMEEAKQVESKEAVDKATDKAVGQPDNKATTKTPAAATAPDVTALPSPAAADVFQGYKLKREAMTQLQKDEQTAIMTNSNSTPQAIAEANARLEELSTLEQQTLALEELIKTKGYKDCVVNTQKESVSIIVQKDKVDSKEAITLIALAKQQLNVPGKNITVSFQP
ncbi:SpoIIIAH-like family protein [Brevibacillus laterosporus]|uniref:SpoIIIAH-like family protein n=1 Tax=Brevibacillus laterosporus TaxID=1465 RepID=A0A502HX31_BRELA|nr:SpoIIIAH-like family protein [Brevibacillus laterosporus]QDX93550.1 SpoIIIAH-like family protein [Brevibacillus laterosporus]TPG73297.1 SpoIIIAH-like family protein [Brevibacillus laterosporus]TPG77680.1 SpoIIIAH-like family protein [Brevibacillus laterosporus]